MAPPKKQMPDWQSPGMDMFEQALHQLDIEAEENKEEVEKIILAISRAEHCYYVLFMSLRKHLTPQQKKLVRPPKRRFPRSVVDNMRDKK